MNEYIASVADHHENTWFGVPITWTDEYRNKAAIAERSGISAKTCARIIGEMDGYKVIREDGF